MLGGSFLKEWQVREEAERKEKEDHKQERRPDAFPLTLLFPVLRFVCLFCFLFICV